MKKNPASKWLCFAIVVLFSASAATLTTPLYGETKALTAFTKEQQEIWDVLEKFQAGYHARDISQVEAFVDDLFAAPDLVIVGTAAVDPNGQDWFLGRAGAINIFTLDWTYWGDLIINRDLTHIQVNDKTAWTVFPATWEKEKTTKEWYDSTMRYIEQTIQANKDDKSPGISRELVFWIAQKAVQRMSELELGNYFVHPIRISAVLVKKQGKWKFTQMHYAFPTTDLPDLRLPAEEKKRKEKR